jgi:Flp pilus assembly protein TadG
MPHIANENRSGSPLPGQGTVEFALVSLLLMMLFLGVLDLGRGVYQRQELTNAVREGSRYASVNSDSATLVADVAAAAARRAPSLSLTSTNFQPAGGGSITCASWSTSTAPATPVGQIAALSGPLGNGLIVLAGIGIAKKPPSGGGSSGSWSTVSCSSAEPGNRLTVCGRYTYRPVATRILRLGPIPLNDCSAITVQ